MKLARRFIVLPLAFLALAGCAEVREDLGLGRSSPDEFAVLDQQPLSMPPDFGLRPPKPGQPRPQEVDTEKRASDTLFPGSSPSNMADAAEPSDAEKALLQQSGADKADPNIGDIVNRETAQRVTGDTHLVDQLLWWKKDESPATTVDASAEAQRIKDAQSKDQPLNQSATPVIERQKSGFLGL